MGLNRGALGCAAVAARHIVRGFLDLISFAYFLQVNMSRVCNMYVNL